MARTRSTLWRTQNFLRDPELVEHLVRSAGIAPSDVVYDLGAGTGVLTEALARRGARVVAIERDPTLCSWLRRRFADRANVSVRRADILRHPLPRSECIVFANPPFDLTSAIVRKLTAAPVPPREAYLVLQREAADRYRGEPRQTLAALLIAPWFALRIVHRFARSDFVPAPAVDVVMVRLRKRGPPLVAPRHGQLYRDLVTASFVSRRPDIGASLRHILGRSVSGRLLGTARIAPQAFPSEVSAVAWLRLFRQFVELPAAVRGRVAGAEARLRRQQRRLQKVHRTRVPRDGLWRAPWAAPARWPRNAFGVALLRGARFDSQIRAVFRKHHVDRLRYGVSGYVAWGLPH